VVSIGPVRGGGHARRGGLPWFPSTTADPETAATFHLLERYHLLAFEPKTSVYEYYNALKRLSHNTGLIPIKVRPS
jgi:hypothetical protein